MAGWILAVEKNIAYISLLVRIQAVYRSWIILMCTVTISCGVMTDLSTLNTDVEESYCGIF